VALTITRIPDRYQEGLAKMIALTPEEVRSIAAALAKAPVNSREDQIAAVERVTQPKTADAEAIITSLYSLYKVKAGAESSVAEFVPILIAAMQATGSRDLTVPDENKEAVIAKLTSLLSMSALERASKVEQLKADHQGIFYDAKILTDLRPVFDQPKERPVGAIVNQTLKIVWHESGEHRELYLSLDTEDVGKLQKIAERAADKMSSLKALLKSANIPDLT